MKKCKYCQSEIDAKAKYCPNCRKKQGIPKWIVILIVIIAFIVIISSTSDSENNSIDTSTSTSDNKTTEKAKEKFSYEVTKQYASDYNVSYYIEGSVKNNKDKDYSYVQIEFVCYDKEGNNLGTAIDNTNNLLANQTWKFKAMAMFSDVEDIEHCDFHEITGW